MKLPRKYSGSFHGSSGKFHGDIGIFHGIRESFHELLLENSTTYDMGPGKGEGASALPLVALNHTECGLTNQRIMGAPFVFHAIPRPASRIVIFRVNIEEASNVRIAFFYGKAFPCSRSIAHSYINVGSAHLPLGKIKTTHCRTK